MKIAAPVALLIGALVLVGVAAVDLSQLPPRMASHFDGRGVADGWSDRSSFFFWGLTLGFGMPAFVSGIFYALRFLPPSFLNVPHPDYWRGSRE